MSRDITYVVLLNWHGWRDTIACLESLFASDTGKLRVLVCDNASADSSLEHIERWARGHLSAAAPEHPRLGRLVGGLARPAYERIGREEAQGADYRAHTPLVLIDNGANLGFAAGNNVGIRLALAQPDMGSVWLLNNDTLVETDCLRMMRLELERARGCAAVGSLIHFFDRPEIIQAIGGNRLNRLTGVAACSEGRLLHEAELPPLETVAEKLDYLSGCSILLPRAFLEDVGLMSEEYFLYYEEIDWFTRAAGRFPLRVAQGAHVYHREGGSIGSPSSERPASCVSDYHMQRSRLLFMRKHYRGRLVGCYFAGLLDAAKRLLLGRIGNASTVMSALLGQDGPRSRA